jgi:hypothetical protein
MDNQSNPAMPDRKLDFDNEPAIVQIYEGEFLRLKIVACLHAITGNIVGLTNHDILYDDIARDYIDEITGIASGLKELRQRYTDLIHKECVIR